LPICAHAFLVDIDDDDGMNDRLARTDILIKIEAAKLELFQGIRIPDAEGQHHRKEE
jgi:hypothetical protein